MTLGANISGEHLLPLYQQVKQEILRSFAGKKAGERIASEAEYIEKFGVSITTVRQAMRELVKEGWIEKRQGRGTFLLDSSARQQKHIAVVLGVDITSENLSPYNLQIMKETKQSLESLGLATRLYFGNLPLGTPASGIHCPDFIADVHLGRIQGLICFFTKRESSWINLLKQKRIPFIDFGFRYENWGKVNTRTFIKNALAYFRERGRQHIALLVRESLTDGYHPLSGPLEELAPEYGIKIERRLLDITANGWERGMGWEHFRDIWYSGSEKPDGLIIGDDMLFSDVQKAISELKIDIPQSLDIVLNTSDAIRIEPQFPVYQWKYLTASVAMSDAQAMKALLEGTPIPTAGKHYSIEYPTIYPSDHLASLQFKE